MEAFVIGFLVTLIGGVRGGLWFAIGFLLVSMLT